MNHEIQSLNKIPCGKPVRYLSITSPNFPRTHPFALGHQMLPAFRHSFYTLPTLFQQIFHINVCYLNTTKLASYVAFSWTINIFTAHITTTVNY